MPRCMACWVQISVPRVVQNAGPADPSSSHYAVVRPSAWSQCPGDPGCLQPWEGAGSSQIHLSPPTGVVLILTHTRAHKPMREKDKELELLNCVSLGPHNTPSVEQG